MKKVILILFLIFLVFSYLVYGEKLATLPDLLKPGTIVIDEDRFYVTEQTTIFIYSLKDFKMMKKFGKAGEGPGEFLNFALAVPHSDHLLINSLGKVSYYTKDGVFEKELKTGGGLFNAQFLPLDEGFVGTRVTQENEIIFITVNYFDSQLKKVKELYRMKSPVQRGGKIEVLERSMSYQTYDNKIFIVGKEGFIIDVLDHTGKPLFSINQQYQKVKFTSEDEKKFRELIKLQARQQYDLFKDRLAFPDYFPEILNFFIDDNKIYVATWKWENDKIEFFIFDMKGKVLKHLFIPFVFQNALQPYPAVIKGGKLYQLIENDDEEWELHVTKVE